MRYGSNKSITSVKMHEHAPKAQRKTHAATCALLKVEREEIKTWQRRRVQADRNSRARTKEKAPERERERERKRERDRGKRARVRGERQA